MSEYIKKEEAHLRKLTKGKSPKKYINIFLIVFLAVLFCELFIFNFKWLNSVFDKEITAASAITGAETSGDGTYLITDSTFTIEFHDVNNKIKYLYLRPGENPDNKMEVSVSAKDEANENFITAPARTAVSAVEQSQYIRLHFSGTVSSLKITISGMEGKTIRDSDIRLNVRVPLMFSWVRVLALFILAMVLFVLRPKSFIYQYKTNLSGKKQKLAMVILIGIYSMIFWGMLHWNTSALAWHENMEHHQQYYKLVDAFKQGHLYISDDVSEELKNMENPYDRYAREANNVSFKWDHAYYEGKYYCYFGAVPALLVYLPYNLITGGNLPNYIAVFILGVLFMIGTALLLWRVIQKWYDQIPFALYLVLHAVFVAVSGLAYVVYKPDFYMIPSLSALVFTVFGLSSWLSAERTVGSARKLCSGSLAIGSFCIALTSGCRPQFLLAAFLGIILFWDHTVKRRILFSKDGIHQTLALCLPFMIVGVIAMWYNVSRFGSVFDFGANYNLTSNDMTHRGFVFGRCGLGIFTYLLQPFNLKATFPFLSEFGVSTVYQGLTLTENLMGGVLSLYPILLIGVYGVLKKKLFRNACVYKMVSLSVVMAVVLSVLDAQMAGLLTRYFSDFVWLLALAAVLTIFALYDTYASKVLLKREIIRFVVILSWITLTIAFFSILAHGEDSIKNSNPVLYYRIQHLIAFWM